MDAETGKFIEVFVMIVVPLAITLCAIRSRFKGHDKEIMELKNRINKLENRKDYDTQRD